MLITLGVWMFLGLFGSIMIALGTLTDGEGLDSWDYVFLAFFTIGGLCVFLIGIPFICMYIRSLMK